MGDGPFEPVRRCLMGNSKNPAGGSAQILGNLLESFGSLVADMGCMGVGIAVLVVAELVNKVECVGGDGEGASADVPEAMQAERPGEEWRRYRPGMPDDEDTRVNWIASGIPVVEGNVKLGAESVQQAMEEAMGVRLAGPFSAMVPRGPRTKDTYGFATIVGVRGVKFDAVLANGFEVERSGELMMGEEAVVRLATHERRPAPSVLHGGCAKLYLAGDCDLGAIEEWVSKVMEPTPGGHPTAKEVQLMDYKGRDDGGEVHGIFMENLDALQRFSWRASFVPAWKDLYFQNKAGEEVKRFQVALPFMGRSKREEADWQSRRIYVAGCGEASNAEMSILQCEFGEGLVDRFASELWIVRGQDKASRGFMFITMMVEEVVKQVVAEKRVNMMGALMRMELATPKAGAVAHQTQLHDGSFPSLPSKRGYSAPGPSATWGQSQDSMKGAFRSVMMEFKHLVDSKHAKESAMQAALEQREFYESIVYEQAVKANEPLLELMRCTERSFERVADVMATSMGVDVGRAAGGNKRKATEDAAVVQQLQQYTQQLQSSPLAVAARQQGGMPVPPPLPPDANMDTTTAWLHQMASSPGGSQLLNAHLASLQSQRQAGPQMTLG
jgi:hypothetical protein